LYQSKRTYGDIPAIRQENKMINTCTNTNLAIILLKSIPMSINLDLLLTARGTENEE
jgi:hypothetical protein